jgi:hypothetical protein
MSEQLHDQQSLRECPVRQPPRNKLIGKLDERLPNLAKVDVDDAHLRANADNARLKGADMVARAAIGANLFVKVTNRSEENLFGDELGSTPVQAPINAALVVRARIDDYPCRHSVAAFIRQRLGSAFISGRSTAGIAGRSAIAEVYLPRSIRRCGAAGFDRQDHTGDQQDAFTIAA